MIEKAEASVGIDSEQEEHIQNVAGELTDEIAHMSEGQRNEAIVVANEQLAEAGVRLVVDPKTEDRALRRERLLHERELQRVEARRKLMAGKIRIDRLK